MTDQQTTEIVLVHLEYIRSKQDEIVLHLRALNGRVGDAEQDIAVLKDRADEARTSGRAWGLTAGGIGSAIAAGLAHLFGGGK